MADENCGYVKQKQRNEAKTKTHGSIEMLWKCCLFVENASANSILMLDNIGKSKT